jgi:threonine dehydrogenase-like Zn-dependent dehydrogenase
MKMKSLLLRGLGDLQLRESSLPLLSEDEVLLKTTHCALCRTDAKMWRQGHRDLKLPRILGHEVCGALPDTVERFVVWPGISCGQCDCCRAGRENLCEAMRIMGFHRDGGLAEYVAAPRGSLIPVPAALDGRLAVLAEPLACTLNALDRVALTPRERVLILGGGPVGLLMALAVLAAQARPLIVEPDRSKLDKSRMFRLKSGVEASDSMGGATWDVVVNAAPFLSTFEEGLPRLRRGGRFCLFSAFTGSEMVPVSLLNELHYREIQVSGAYGCTREQMQRALAVIDANRECAEWLIEETISLVRVPDALSAILAGRVLKYVVDCERG